MDLCAVGDDHSEQSEVSVSTSGCSSMVPHPDHRDYQQDVLQLNDVGLSRLATDPAMVAPSMSAVNRAQEQMG